MPGREQAIARLTRPQQQYRKSIFARKRVTTALATSLASWPRRTRQQRSGRHNRRSRHEHYHDSATLYGVVFPTANFSRREKARTVGRQ